MYTKNVLWRAESIDKKKNALVVGNQYKIPEYSKQSLLMEDLAIKTVPLKTRDYMYECQVQTPIAHGST